MTSSVDLFTVFTLQSRLREITRAPVVLRITDNCSTMLSRHQGVLRAHKMFLNSPDAVVKGLADFFLHGSRRNCVQVFIDQNSAKIDRSSRRPRTVKIITRGKYFDLAEIAAVVNRDYFSGQSRATITWGRQIAKVRARATTLGHFDQREMKITISRRLDHADVPRYFVEYVMYHEMLHEAMGVARRADGKRDIHGTEFKRRERLFAQYQEARAFEKRWK